MALSIDQAEIPPRKVGHRYGDIHVYGNAMLGDGSMTIKEAPRDPEEQKRMSKPCYSAPIPAFARSSDHLQF